MDTLMRVGWSGECSVLYRKSGMKLLVTGKSMKHNDVVELLRVRTPWSGVLGTGEGRWGSGVKAVVADKI
jgi:hypothetical protein